MGSIYPIFLRIEDVGKGLLVHRISGRFIQAFGTRGGARKCSFQLRALWLLRVAVHSLLAFGRLDLCRGGCLHRLRKWSKCRNPKPYEEILTYLINRFNHKPSTLLLHTRTRNPVCRPLECLCPKPKQTPPTANLKS